MNTNENFKASESMATTIGGLRGYTVNYCGKNITSHGAIVSLHCGPKAKVEARIHADSLNRDGFNEVEPDQTGTGWYRPVRK